MFKSGVADTDCNISIITRFGGCDNTIASNIAKINVNILYTAHL